MSEITVLFLSEQKLLRESFASAFTIEHGLVFLPPVSTVSEAIECMISAQPDVVLIDLNPALFGIRVAQQLRGACPGCKLVVLASRLSGPAKIQLALAGVTAVLSKDIGLDDLARAIREANSGKSVFWDEKGGFSETLASLDGARPLTGRETEILEGIARGLANKQIAAELAISIKTVEKHRQSLMRKLQARETAALTWHAVCLGVRRQP